MRRRGLIVGAGGLAASVLAGCLGSEQVALSQRPPENAVEDGIRTAIGEANTVALRLATAREEATTPAQVSFDAATLEDGIGASTAALDDAAQRDAASDYQAELSAARTYVGVVEALLQGSASLVDVASQLLGIESSIATGDDDAASQSLGSIQPTVDDARSTTTAAQSSLRNLDAELLDPYGAKRGELTDGLATVQNLALGADELAAGYTAVLTGRDRLAAGQAAVQQTDFPTAETEFQAAESQFRDATGHFQTARSETDGELETQISTALCRSQSLTNAAAHFEASAVAAQQGDLATAQSERSDGQDDLAAAGSC